MTKVHQHIGVQKLTGVWVVRLQSFRMTEPEMIEMADEIVGLIEDDGCRKLVICLGPGELACLYSIFLAKLVSIRRHMLEAGGALRFAEASENTLNVFRACDLDKILHFVPTVEEGAAELQRITVA